ncbi:hypothetical protein BKA93DRAFT_99522 [Sparassis latifolia]
MHGRHGHTVCRTENYEKRILAAGFSDRVCVHLLDYSPRLSRLRLICQLRDGRGGWTEILLCFQLRNRIFQAVGLKDYPTFL